LRTADLILDLFVDRVFRIENQEAASDLTADSWHRVDGYFIVVALGCTGHGHLRRCRRVAAAVHEESTTTRRSETILLAPPRVPGYHQQRLRGTIHLLQKPSVP
jgi:hypothetical protein